MRFLSGARGKEERRSRSSRSAVAERQRPQPINGKNRIVRILYEPDELVRKAVIGRDPAAAEVANQNRVAELAEVSRCPHHSPWRIQPRAMLKVTDVFAGWGEDFDEAIAIS